MKNVFALIYTNLTTHAIYFRGAFSSIEDARQALTEEMEKFYLAGTWEFKKDTNSALVIDTTMPGSPVKHGKFCILKH